MVTKRKILIIEDEEDISRALAFRLQKIGFDVSTTADGKQGLDQVRRTIPDLIVLDLALPSLSGEEICKSIREDHNEEIAGIPILMLTAKTSEADRIIGKVIGANVYMTKPFQTDELLAEIQQLMEVPLR